MNSKVGASGGAWLGGAVPGSASVTFGNGFAGRCYAAQHNGLVHGVAEICPPCLPPMPLREPPASADRHDLAELELLARELSRGTGGAIRPAGALQLVLVAAAARSSTGTDHSGPREKSRGGLHESRSL